MLNPAKEQRNNVDRIQPLRLFMLGSLFFDPRFAVRFLARAGFHLLRRRIFTLRAWTERFRRLPRILREEVFAMGGFDQAAERYLQKLRGVHTLIVGHSHAPRFRVLPSSKLIVNTGTWMKMINLDLQLPGPRQRADVRADRIPGRRQRAHAADALVRNAASMRKRALRLLMPALLRVVAARAARRPRRAQPRRAAATHAAHRGARSACRSGRPRTSTSSCACPDGDEQPLLLTPASEGDAVRVVRGRLMRADAQPTPNGELRFEVPVVVRSAGTAVLRVDVLTYHCERSAASRCAHRRRACCTRPRAEDRDKSTGRREDGKTEFSSSDALNFPPCRLRCCAQLSP